MNYTAVSTYADNDSSTIDEYQLQFAAIYDGDDIIDANNGVRYFRTPPTEWTKIELEDGLKQALTEFNVNDIRDFLNNKSNNDTPFQKQLRVPPPQYHLECSRGDVKERLTNHTLQFNRKYDQNI